MERSGRIIKAEQHTNTLMETHVRSQLLGMRPQMETTLHYLVLIKDDVNKRCVKSITAASLRQDKHMAMEREKMFKNKDAHR